MQQVIPLELLNMGQMGRIHDLDGSVEMVTRLQEMGLRQGVAVKMLRPGRPCIVAVNSHRLSFRGEECASIFVEVIG